MSGGQATLDALTFEDDEEGEETPVGDEEEQAELSVPSDSDLREDADTDDTDDATDEGADDDSLPGPEDLREGPAVESDTSSSTSSSTGGKYGPCKVCGEMSDKCYKCSECGKPW